MTAAAAGDRARQGANILFAAGQLLVPPLLFAGGFDANVAQPVRVAAPNPATPAAYAFAIWGAIFLGAAAYAVMQALPGRADDPLYRRIGWLTASGYALCCGWLLFARFGPLWATVPIIGAMLVLLGIAFVRAARMIGREDRVRRIFVLGPLAIYAGWLSAATFVNAADVLPGYGFGRFGLAPADFGALVILAGGLTSAILLLLSRGNGAYAAAMLWALAGIAVANGVPAAGNPLLLSVAIAAAVIVALAIAARSATAKDRPPGPASSR